MINITNALCNKKNSFLMLGAALIILGTLALGSGYVTTMATIVFLGVVLAAAGISQFVHSFWSATWRGFFSQLFVGILSGVTGWLMITRPAIGALSVTLLLASLFIASGLFKIANAFMIEDENWGLILLNGIITLALGIILFAQWPKASFWFIGMFIAVDLIFTGWMNVMLAFKLRKQCKVIEPNNA